MSEKGVLEALPTDEDTILNGPPATPLASASATPQATTEAATEYPKGFRFFVILMALILSMFLVALDMTIVATAIPRITDEFHSLDQVGWYGSAFFLTLASFQSTWGKLYKYFPLKTIFLESVVIFELGSLICARAQNSPTLVIGRAITGWGAAGAVSGCYIIIAYLAPPERRPAYTGILGATFGLASVAGPLLGGVFTDKLSWRWCFYINLPIGGVSFLTLLLLFKSPAASRPVDVSWQERLLQMDLIGTFTIVAAMTCFLLALQWGGATKQWSSPDVIGLLVGILNEALFSAITGSLIVLVGYFQPFLTIGGILTTIGAGLIYSLDIGTSSARYLSYQAMFGVGNGLCIQVPLIASQAFSDPADIPLVTAIVLFFQTIGGALFISGAQSIFANRMLQTLPINSPGIEPARILAVGASELRESFSPAQIPGILESYMTGIRGGWALGIALTAVSVLVSFGPEMKSIKKQARTGPSTAEVTEAGNVACEKA
ncbi:MAG: hypothetical protein M1837_007516 [Sclerophora amabilis]|nr:MAG: hypothetical protein M1837_007516 [Sclerophora amabilis]